MAAPRRVSLFITCVVDQFFPAVGLSVVEVLERLGIAVDFPEAQTCCGQPAFNSGFHEEARQVARTMLRAFADSEVVVAPSGSCTAMVRHGYEEIFHDYPTELAEARALAARTYEFSEFLHNILHIEDTGAPRWNGAVTLHPSCHLSRELGIREPAKKLLAAVPGIDVREMALADDCCGFGGTFAVKFDGISAAMADDKLNRAAESGASHIVACDMSCLMHLDGRARRRGMDLHCVHLAQVLAGRP
jgi:L-lactate dehydrogenase complex protein LldE